MSNGADGADAKEQSFRWDAFVSYSASDGKFAKWLKVQLEGYGPPRDVVPDQRKLRVFLYEQDMTESELTAGIVEHIRSSNFMIVVCSPNARRSHWIGKETKAFAQHRDKSRTLPVIVAGRPNSEVKADDKVQDQAFPDDLCKVLTEPRAADFREHSRPGESKGEANERKREAKFELVARLFDTDKGKLLQRQRARERTRNRVIAAIGAAVVLALAGLTIWAVLNAAEARRQARVALSRHLAAQSTNLRQKQLDLSLMLAVAAYSADRSVEARAALLDGLQGSDLRLDAFLRGHSGFVMSVAFSPDGKTLASGSYDNTVILWDVAKRQQVGAPLAGHSSSVTSVAFSPDGKTLVSGSYDKKVMLWDVDVQSWVARAKRIANRELTTEERRQYLGTE